MIDERQSNGAERHWYATAAWLSAALILIAILATTLIILHDDGNDQPAATPPVEQSNAPSDEAAPPEPSPLASGRDEDFMFVVTNVERGIPATIDGERVAEGTFTFITLTVRNVGDEQLGFSKSDVVAIDSRGRTLVNGIQEDSAVRVDPGGQTITTVVFDVPDREHLTTIIATGASAGSMRTWGGVEIPLP